jgi:hypothetical protein
VEAKMKIVYNRLSNSEYQQKLDDFVGNHPDDIKSHDFRRDGWRIAADGIIVGGTVDAVLRDLSRLYGDDMVFAYYEVYDNDIVETLHQNLKIVDIWVKDMAGRPHLGMVKCLMFYERYCSENLSAVLMSTPSGGLVDESHPFYGEHINSRIEDIHSFEEWSMDSYLDTDRYVDKGTYLSMSVPVVSFDFIRVCSHTGVGFIGDDNTMVVYDDPCDLSLSEEYAFFCCQALEYSESDMGVYYCEGCGNRFWSHKMVYCEEDAAVYCERCAYIDSMAIASVARISRIRRGEMKESKSVLPPPLDLSGVLYKISDGQEICVREAYGTQN